MNWIHIVEGPWNRALVADLYKVNEFHLIYPLAPGGKILEMAVGKPGNRQIFGLLHTLVLRLRQEKMRIWSPNVYRCENAN